MIIIKNESIEKIFTQYIIKLTLKVNLINISIQKINSYIIYESNFNQEFFYYYKLLFSNLSLKEIMDFICELIEQKKIQIEENKNNLKLILLFNPNSIVKLILKKKEIIETLKNEIEYLKEENKHLKESFKNLNEKIKEKEKIENNNKINYEYKTKEIEKRIEILEGFHFIKDKYKIQLTNCNLNNINTIQLNNNKKINSLSSFPSGNIISVSSDKSIKIYDIHLNLLQDIQNAHDNSISYLEIKDENNFITCSSDKNIKLWIKKEKQFQINKIIKEAHEDKIRKVIYCLNSNLISCSWDKTIKLWKENNNKYESFKTLNHSDKICSIILLEDKNILISSGYDGTKLWDLNNYNNIKCIKYFQETWCGSHCGLCRLDEDKIIVQGKTIDYLNVISIKNKKIIKKITNLFTCWVIILLEDKGIFLVGGESKNIKIFRRDNYDCIQIINNAHNNYISCFLQLKNDSIVSYSYDNTIKIWSF